MKLSNKFPTRQAYLNYYKRIRQLGDQPVAKISGLVSLTLFTVAFFGVFAIAPTFRTIAELNRQIEDSELVNSKLAQKAAALSKAEDTYLQLGNDLEKVDRLVPEGAEFERLAWQLNYLANTLGLTIGGGNFGEFLVKGVEAVDPKKDSVLTAEITLNGNFLAIKEFIKMVESMDRLVVVDQVSISSKRIARDVSTITSNLRLSAYYLP